ncbi:aldo/keto reductase [Frankia sp. AgPm24]|nr:aldo/keto reductase [Frankia sp. AgPm24]MCK9925413.1 aldo/keto reductase [Frankia sp. AgPm24]
MTSSTQCSYSLVHRDLEHELLPYRQADNVGVLCCSPLAAGQLTGWRDTPSAPGRRRMGTMSPLPGPTLRAARAALDLVARAHGVSMAQVALAWLLAQPGSRPSSSGRAGSSSWRTTSVPRASC